MKKIKTLFAVLMVFTMVLGLTACAGTNSSGTANKQENEAQKTSEQNVTETEPEKESAGNSTATAENTDTAASNTDSANERTSAEDTSDQSDILVAYFSATGTTKGVAEKITAITSGDLYEIVPAEPYSAADLNWNDRNSRSTKEQNDKGTRPEIGSENISFDGYTTIYLGFPIWWGEEPRILDTFVEKYSFEGITVIPFCTSSSSGIGRSGPNMEALAGGGTWLDGKRFGGNVSEADLRSWLEGLK